MVFLEYGHAHDGVSMLLHQDKSHFRIFVLHKDSSSFVALQISIHIYENKIDNSIYFKKSHSEFVKCPLVSTFYDGGMNSLSKME